MNVVVLLSGIADPKWPLAVAADGRPAVSNRILSPFDEAAIEIALKIRDSLATSTLAFVIVGEAESDSLVRMTAAFRPDRLVRLDTGSSAWWDGRGVARKLKAGVSNLDLDAHLILIGREFGDWDDGTVPPCLAEELRWQFFGLCQVMRGKHDALTLMREVENVEEWIDVGEPLVASITNDRRNRLRHPLMKNVMAARSATFVTLHLPRDDEAPAQIQSGTLALAEPRKRQTSCRMLTGSVECQAAELAAYLRLRR